MSTTLDNIVAARRRAVALLKAAGDVRALRAQAEQYRPRGFRTALARAAAAGPAVIAELKKASPSRGVIRGSFPVGRLATALAAAGAAALSVLTEEDYFQGSLAHLREASAATHLPCLRKDFIVDEVQLIEARAHHADAVLLIVAALSDGELPRLAGLARELQLDVLCEVHDEEELERALTAGCDMIGVNCRDLRTFRVDMSTALRLGPAIPPGVLGVAESGIQSADDIRRLRGHGYGAFLIGESLMRADDPGAELVRLLAESKAPPLGTPAAPAWSTGTKD